MEISQKHLQTYKIQDALKKRYALTQCAYTIRAANCSKQDRRNYLGGAQWVNEKIFEFHS